MSDAAAQGRVFRVNRWGYRFRIEPVPNNFGVRNDGGERFSEPGLRQGTSWGRIWLRATTLDLNLHPMNYAALRRGRN